MSWADADAEPTEFSASQMYTPLKQWIHHLKLAAKILISTAAETSFYHHRWIVGGFN